jgi:hypothetical protein
VHFSGKKFNCKNNEAEQENEQADPVDPMHVTNPGALRPVRVFFPEIEIFCHLFEHAHEPKGTKFMLPVIRRAGRKNHARRLLF